MSDSTLAHLRALLAKATMYPGKPVVWFASRKDTDEWSVFERVVYKRESMNDEADAIVVARIVHSAAYGIVSPLDAAQAKAICALRNAAPGLLRVVEAAKTVLTEPQMLAVTDPSTESLRALRDALRELEEGSNG